ncbi:expressed unknown protein [Seminavis robusta]|uniref:Uncharacterized protein n=1 Tax=Seminavis robusta TaxID=568900 RepID=A0A9N8ENJ8_9STRA|nr:expressed unknown protein [Seminavis robusta]|eukprot:Sro1435_g272360.1 n/a (86) ;mRNA; r:4899-5156
MSRVVYGDARDYKRKETAAKEGKGLKHFNYFLENYCLQINVPVVTGDKIPYHGLLIKAKDFNENDLREVYSFWDSMMAAFTTYMG